MEAKPQFEPEGEGITVEISPTAPAIDTSEQTTAPLRIRPTDPSWLTSFPHLVKPLLDEDEAFPGFTLRCDAVHGWPSGITFSFAVTGYGDFSYLAPNYMVPVYNRIEELADALKISSEDIRATTFLDAMTTLISKQPGPFQPGRLSRPTDLAVCPACIAEQQLIRRMHTLPAVTYCPHHNIMLAVRCTCGAHLLAFPSGLVRNTMHKPPKPPFSCWHCGRAWKDLPRKPVDANTLSHDRLLVSLYTAFLYHPSDDTYRRALALLDHRMPPSLPSPEGWLEAYRDWIVTIDTDCLSQKKPLTVQRLVKYLARDRFHGACLSTEYFPVSRNRYVRDSKHHVFVNFQPTEFGQPCQCGDRTWHTRLSPDDKRYFYDTDPAHGYE